MAKPTGGFDEPTAPIPTTPVSTTPCPVKSAFGLAPENPGNGWVAIGRDSPAAKAELAKRLQAKYSPAKGKR
jgi:hypothetical protein